MSTIGSRLDFTQATEDDLKKLADACDPATFGRNQEDVHDETYRSAGVLDLPQFAIGFEPLSAGVIGSIEDLLLEGHKRSKVRLVHELYKLNIYDPGQFFKAHKDTPRADNMIGSLVVVLPTIHTGGALSLQHECVNSTFDSAALLSSASKSSVAFTAFFGDVIHEVAPVVEGYRVTLTYNLSLADLSPATSTTCDAQRPAIRAALVEAIENPEHLPNGGYIGFELRDEYHGPIARTDWRTSPDKTLEYETSAPIVPFLKGSDAVLSEVSESLGLQASIWVAYQSDDNYAAILCNRRVVMPDYEIESGPWLLIKQHGGMRVQKTS